MVMRYFEGLAAGTRLLGVLPRSGELLFPQRHKMLGGIDSKKISSKIQSLRIDH
jgi:hypothetical protein